MTATAHLLHDDPLTLDLAETVLGAEGFEVRRATDSYRLLALPRDPAPDLVLVGLTAVDERDVDLVALLRERSPESFVVLAFPSSLRERAVAALEQGGDAYLPEPFYPAELAALARRVAARRNAPTSGSPKSSDRLDGPQPGSDALERLSGGVSHLVAQPLQILNLMLGSVEAGEVLVVEDARRQLDRIASVARDLGRFGDVTRARPHRHPVAVNAVVESVFSQAVWLQEDEKNLGIKLDLDPTDPTVPAQPESLRTALTLLRERARRVTPAGGTVRVSSRVTTADGSRRVVVTVEDGGETLGPDRLKRLFDPDPDQDALQSGTWLDLPAVAGIVRNHGGRVSACPGRTCGLSILVELPATGP